MSRSNGAEFALGLVASDAPGQLSRYSVTYLLVHRSKHLAHSLPSFPHAPETLHMYRSLLFSQIGSTETWRLPWSLRSTTWRKLKVVITEASRLVPSCFLGDAIEIICCTRRKSGRAGRTGVSSQWEKPGSPEMRATSRFNFKRPAACSSSASGEAYVFP